MRMWMWFGYDLGEFLFPHLEISTRWAFALTWIVLFFSALLFEGSKVYLARVQREAHKKLYPFRSDERRNLLSDREQGGNMEPTTSRNASTGQVSRWASLKVRTLVNTHQTLVFVVHNTVGYLLMLCVMVYNVHLLLAVVFGMMLGYFLFGPKLTRLQMQCFSSKRDVICTPECDDTDRCNTEKCSWEVCEGKLCKKMDAMELQQTDTNLKFIPYFYVVRVEPLTENTTPPLLDSSLSSESDFFICRTRTCIQPSHYFPATSSDGASNDFTNATCYYGAKKCPSRVAKAKRMQIQIEQPHCSHESEKEDSPSVEDVQLLRTERQGCCKKKQEPPPQEKCCKKSSQTETSRMVDTVRKGENEPCCDESEESESKREDSPQITCCHSAMAAPSDSQEQIIK